MLNNSQTSFSRFGVASSDKSHVDDYGSIGVTSYIKEIKSAAQMFDCADKGLYKAKKTGKNKVIYKNMKSSFHSSQIIGTLCRQSGSSIFFIIL